METVTAEVRIAGCPFGDAQVETAKAVFLANPVWQKIYDGAPTGAKCRLEVSFWFSQNNNETMTPDIFEQYRRWRTDVESLMTEEDLEYMIEAVDKPTAKEHYAGLLKERKSDSPVAPGVKLMSYDDFFAMLGKEGEFNSFDYDEGDKASILSDFAPVLEGSGDPLETHLEDILATAELKEARTYPKNEVIYVRVNVRFLTDTAEWSKSYQMLAAWDCLRNLMGYTFPVGKGRRCELPIWLEEPENKAQHDMRQRLKVARMTVSDGK